MLQHVHELQHARRGRSHVRHRPRKERFEKRVVTGKKVVIGKKVAAGKRGAAGKRDAAGKSVVDGGRSAQLGRIHASSTRRVALGQQLHSATLVSCFP